MDKSKPSLENSCRFEAYTTHTSENRSQCSQNVAKRCSKCQETKLLSEFDRDSKRGSARYCKVCKKFYESKRRAVYQPIYRLKNQEKHKAHRAVENAKRYGRIKPPFFCEHCSQIAKLEAHHDDYSKPLEVRWLCRDCHVIADLQRRRAA